MRLDAPPRVKPLTKGLVQCVVVTDGETYQGGVVRGYIGDFYSEARVCPYCGDVWAKVFVYIQPELSNTWTYRKIFTNKMQPCTKHGSGAILSARKYDKKDRSYAHNQEIVKREIDLELRHTTEKTEGGVYVRWD